MRRDYFTLEVRNLEPIEGDADPEQPTVVIDFEGPASLLEERLTSSSGDLLEDAEIDVSFRYQTPRDTKDAHGVASLTNRLTGDYILELNVSAHDVDRFVRAAREYGKQVGPDEHRYRIEIWIEGERTVAYDKRTFLIYNREGNLLRKHSLIPSGVEL